MSEQHDPFKDKRFNQRGRPSAAKKKAQKKKDNFQRTVKKRIPKAEAELAAIKDKVRLQKGQLTMAKNKTQELLEAMANAPTPAAQRKIMHGMFCDSGLNPLKELLEIASKTTGKNALPPKERRDLLLKLLEYQAPKPKSIDIQADVSSSVTIKVVDFANTTQKQLKSVDAIEVPEDKEFDEFLSPEQIAQREKEKAINLAIDAVVEEESDED